MATSSALHMIVIILTLANFTSASQCGYCCTFPNPGTDILVFALAQCFGYDIDNEVFDTSQCRLDGCCLVDYDESGNAEIDVSNVSICSDYINQINALFLNSATCAQNGGVCGQTCNIADYQGAEGYPDCPSGYVDTSVPSCQTTYQGDVTACDTVYSSCKQNNQYAVAAEAECDATECQCYAAASVDYIGCACYPQCSFQGKQSCLDLCGNAADACGDGGTPGVLEIRACGAISAFVAAILASTCAAAAAPAGVLAPAVALFCASLVKTAAYQACTALLDSCTVYTNCVSGCISACPPPPVPARKRALTGRQIQCNTAICNDPNVMNLYDAMLAFPSDVNAQGILAFINSYCSSLPCLGPSQRAKIKRSSF